MTADLRLRPTDDTTARACGAPSATGTARRGVSREPARGVDVTAADVTRLAAGGSARMDR